MHIAGFCQTIWKTNLYTVYTYEYNTILHTLLLPRQIIMQNMLPNKNLTNKR